MQRIENKITRFQNYTETELACINPNPFFSHTKFGNTCLIREKFWHEHS